MGIFCPVDLYIGNLYFETLQSFLKSFSSTSTNVVLNEQKKHRNVEPPAGWSEVPGISFQANQKSNSCELDWLCHQLKLLKSYYWWLVNEPTPPYWSPSPRKTFLGGPRCVSSGPFGWPAINELRRKSWDDKHHLVHWFSMISNLANQHVEWTSPGWVCNCWLMLWKSHFLKAHWGD